MKAKNKEKESPSLLPWYADSFIPLSSPAKNKEKESDLFPSSLLTKWKSDYDLSINSQDRWAPEDHKAVTRNMRLRAHLQSFLADGDFNHVLHLISYGYIEHPLIQHIISHLRDVIISEKRDKINQRRKQAEIYIKEIEKAFHQFLLHPIKLLKPPHKTRQLLIAVVEVLLTQEGRQSRKTFTRADVLGYINDIYEKKTKALGHRNKEEKLARYRESRAQNISRQDSLMEKRADPKLIEDIKREIKYLDKKISTTEKQKSAAHEQAKQDTIDELYEETGVRIGDRNLEELLAEAKQLDLG